MKLSLFSIERDKNDVVNLIKSHIKGIDTPNPTLDIIFDGITKTVECPHMPDLNSALEWVLETLKADATIEFDPKKICAVGHRVVHGGDFIKSEKITPEVLQAIEHLSEMAPLHNPASVDGIKAALRYFSNRIPQIAVFDTVFNNTIPQKAALYGIPEGLAKKHHIKRYGFHGISHAYLCGIYNQQPNSGSKAITMHLGSGCSMSAIKNGIVLENSMGFTPAEGLLMSTRAGDIDAAVVEYLCLHENLTPTDVIKILNFDSGLLGISGISGNMGKVIDAFEKDPRARLAVEMFCYRVIKYIGAYIAVLEGVDALIFSAGIGENSPLIRQKIIEGMEWFGIKLDVKANDKAKGISSGEVHKVSTNESTVAVFAIGTDENILIAREVLKLL